MQKTQYGAIIEKFTAVPPGFGQVKTAQRHAVVPQQSLNAAEHGGNCYLSAATRVVKTKRMVSFQPAAAPL